MHRGYLFKRKAPLVNVKNCIRVIPLFIVHGNLHYPAHLLFRMLKNIITLSISTSICVLYNKPHYVSSNSKLSKRCVFDVTFMFYTNFTTPLTPHLAAAGSNRNILASLGHATHFGATDRPADESQVRTRRVTHLHELNAGVKHPIGHPPPRRPSVPWGCLPSEGDR